MKSKYFPKRTLFLLLITFVFIFNTGIYGGSSIQSPSAIDNGLRVSLAADNSIYAGYDKDESMEITFSLNRPSTKEISFDYVIYPGSAPNELYECEDTGSLTFATGETEKSLTINIKKLINNPAEYGIVSNPWEFWTGDRIFYINCKNIINALFDNDRESITLPLSIKNRTDLSEIYENAKNTYFLNTDELENVVTFPDTPGKFENISDNVVLFQDKPITRDMRTMLDTHVFTHINLPVGYFMNGINGEGATFRIEKTDKWDYKQDIYSKYVEFNNDEKTYFNFGTEEYSSSLPISAIELGPNAEGNGITAKSYGAYFDYTVTEAVYTYFMDDYEALISLQMNFADEISPQVKYVNIPDGTFYYGESIPITVTYTEPVLVDDISICANGEVLYPMESKGTISDSASFLYEADENYKGIIDITNIGGATDLSGKTQESVVYGELNNAQVESFNPRKILSYLGHTSATINQGNSVNASVEIKISLKDSADFTNWLSDKTYDDTVNVIKGRAIGSDGSIIDIFLKPNNGPIINELKGSFLAPANLTGSPKEYLAEILIDKEDNGTFEPIYSLAVSYEVPPVIFINDDKDLEITYTNWPQDDKKYLDDTAPISLGYMVKNDATWQSPEDFSWSSSNDTIASINSSTGSISFTGKEGDVYFILTAHNGYIPDKEFSLNSNTLHVLESDGTFLYISENVKNIEIMKNSDAKLYYTFGGNKDNMNFTFSLHEAVYDGDVIEKGTLVMQESIDGATSLAPPYIISRDHLTITSPMGKSGYMAEVSAKDKDTGREYGDYAYICVKEPAAKAVLNIPENLYITDQKSAMNIDFYIENKNAGTLWDLTVSKNGTNVYNCDSTNSTVTSYEIPIEKVNSGKLLDVYKVTLRAKNSFDETYSFDTYNMYVYNEASLKIKVNGDIVDSLTVSASTDLSKKTSDEILELLEQNKLIKDYEITIDQSFPWSNIDDKLSWKTENPEDIISLSSSNARDISKALPGCKLFLKGKAAGTDRITVEHIATGMKTSLDVNVDNLGEKLFIFQTYPAQKCTVRYRNGYGSVEEKETNDKGRIAIYESSGIKSDVDFYPSNTALSRNAYLKNSDLMLNQASMKSLSDFPVNIVKIPSVEHHFVLSMADYGKDIIVRGGVYRNGKYCPAAKINGKPGNEDQILSTPYDGYGEYDLIFDSAEFINGYVNTPIGPDDNIEFVLEVKFPDNDYKTMFVKIDKEKMEEIRYDLSGRAFVFEKPEEFEAENLTGNVYVVSRKLIVNGKEQALPDNLPITERYDDVFIKTEMLLGFDSSENKNFKIVAWDKENDWSLFSKTEVLENYEFSDHVRILNTYDLDERAFRLKPGEKSSLNMKVLIIESDKTEDVQLPGSINLQKLYNIPKMETELNYYLSWIKTSIAATMTSTEDLFGTVNFPDISDILPKYSKYSWLDTNTIRMEVSPTEDPLVYKGIVKFAAGALTRENPSGVFTVNDKGTSETLNFMPGLSDIKAMKKGDYLKKSKETMVKNQSGASGHDQTYGGGAYIECEIYYDVKTMRWKTFILQSDVFLGAGASYYRMFNTMAGPVPVTAEFRTGLTGQIGLKILSKRIYDEDTDDFTVVKDYVTELRPYWYIYGFGGIGADYVVASLKVGVYGQIDLDQHFMWLNKDYDNYEKLNGQKITISGETGVKFQASVLFINYTKKYKLGGVSKSWVFNNYNEIENYIKKEMKKSGRAMFALQGAEGEYLLFEEDGEESSFENKPCENPIFSDDGKLMIYISNMNSNDTNNRSLCYAENTQVDPSDYADANGVISGTKDMAAAAWVRTMKKIEQNPDEETSLTELYDIISSSEIMASIYDGTTFNTTRLTDNSIPDMSPAVAAKDGKAIVIWKNAYASDKDDPLNFDGRNCIMYSFFDGANWSEGKQLTSEGNVTSYNVTMLNDGTSAIAYELQEADGSSDIFVVIIGDHGEIKSGTKLPHSYNVNTNPQITSLEFPDGEERFVVSQNNYDEEDGAVSDPALIISAMDKNGDIYKDFGKELKGTSFYQRARFIKGAKSLNELSVIWEEPDTDGNTTIWGRAFSINDKGNIIESADMKLLELETGEEMDSYDAYIDDDGNINFVLLISKGEKQEIKRVTKKFENDIAIDDISFFRDELLPRLTLPITFTVYNKGKEEINELKITIDGKEKTFDENILPGEYKELKYMYEIPEDVTDQSYSIKACYLSAPTVEKIGILNMSLPDVGIGQIKILEEKNRERLLGIKLYNSVFSPLEYGKHKIELNIYDNSDFDSAPLLTETIEDVDSLNSINNGSYVKTITLGEGMMKGLLNAKGEIPKEGSRIFVKAYLEENDNIEEDADISNDWGYINLQSLLVKNQGPVSLWSAMKSDKEGTVIKVIMQNNSMNVLKNGYIVAKLEDKNHKILGSMTKNILPTKGEETSTYEFSFDKPGVYNEVYFVNEIIDEPKENKEEDRDKHNGGDNKGADTRGQKEPILIPKEVSHGMTEERFSDVTKNDWFYEAIKYVYDKGLMIGTGENTFAPYSPVNRAMFVTLLHRMSPESEERYVNIFEDIKNDAYYSEAVAWASYMGIVNGINANEFAPDANITREQTVVMLYRFAKTMGYDIMKKAELRDYKDWESLSDYAISPMEWAVASGIIKGTGEYELSPKGIFTRAEMAAVLQRFLIGE